MLEFFFFTWIDCKLGKIVAVGGFVGFSFHCFLSHLEDLQRMIHFLPVRLLFHLSVC